MALEQMSAAVKNAPERIMGERKATKIDKIRIAILTMPDKKKPRLILGIALFKKNHFDRGNSRIPGCRSGAI